MIEGGGVSHTYMYMYELRYTCTCITGYELTSKQSHDRVKYYLGGLDLLPRNNERLLYQIKVQSGTTVPIQVKLTLDVIRNGTWLP